MKAVLISIKPKWCEKIESGEKTIEIRKTKPKIKLPFKCFIYKTENGGVIGEFICNKIIDFVFFNDTKETSIGMKKACISEIDVGKYLGNKRGYAWYISQLKIYDKPKELSEFNLKRPPQSWCYV